MQNIRRNQGFTLIELMIVVAIVGILAAIALPVYQDYVARSQVSEAIATAGAVKTSITEFRATQGAWPAAGLYNDATPGRYTNGVTHDGAGVITVTMHAATPVNTRVQGASFTLSPTLTGQEITDWNCAATTPASHDKYLPSGCR